MVNPIILGGGLRAFETAGTVPLRLIRARPLTAGNVLLYYRPDFTGRQFRHERSRKVARPVWKVRT
jgi:hypothetical protein